MTSKVFQIQIALKGLKPKIWRRILVPSNVLLADFHYIIQTTMGWTDSHLHHFVKGRTYYAAKHFDDDMFFKIDNVDYNRKKIRLSDLLRAEKDRLVYEYDFGDGWRHDVILEKILPLDKEVKYPVCIAGKRNCPPEDCGGIWGYDDMLETLEHPDHKDYKSLIEWLGGEFDPEYFNKDEINKLLQDNY